MNDIPSWWFGLSAAFFVVGILLFVAIVIALFYIVRMLQDLQPKVEGLIVKVESTAERVEEVATTAKQTLDAVGGRAKHVVESADSIATVASKQLGRFSPIIMGVMTAFRVMKAFNEYRQSRPPQPKTAGDHAKLAVKEAKLAAAAATKAATNSAKGAVKALDKRH